MSELLLLGTCINILYNYVINLCLAELFISFLTFFGFIWMNFMESVLSRRYFGLFKTS